ncbi:MAG: hypothetical protein ACOC7L_00870 [Acidobacteriota bacterium]
MSVETLQRLHGRYAALSSRFRAGWAFHQYAQSLRKIFPDAPQPDLSSAFQEVHSALKSISARLNAEDPEVIEKELDEAEATLGHLTSTLAEEDSRVSPQLVRQFFQRVKNDDDNVLTQLVKFYVYAGGRSKWPEDRLDKVDFLLTRVAEERDPASGRVVLIERGRLREIASGLWSLVGSEPPGDTVVDGIVEQLRDLRSGIAGADTLDQLNDAGLVTRHRELKHGLGCYFFFPRILYEILDSNLALKNLIQQLYSVEERRITTEYQRLFDLEREAVVDGELDRELRHFREEVEAFERRLQDDELKLKDLAHLRRRVRSLSSRLGTPDREPRAAAEPSEEAGAGSELVDRALARLRSALDEVDPELPPKRAVLGSEVYGLRLEPRELVAHRRLTQDGAGGDGATGLDLERTVLEAAAVRVAANLSVEEIRGLLDETATTGEAPVFASTRALLRQGSAYAERLTAAAEEALLAGRTTDAQELTVLRMRMVRDHAGAWLLAVRPLLSIR